MIYCWLCNGALAPKIFFLPQSDALQRDNTKQQATFLPKSQNEQNKKKRRMRDIENKIIETFNDGKVDFVSLLHSLSVCLSVSVLFCLLLKII